MIRRAGFLAVGLACLGGFYLLASWLVTPFALAGSGTSGGSFQIADFLYQISLTEAYWSGLIETPYATGEQARVLKTYFGSAGNVAMAHGMSPVVLVLWYPFTLLSRMHPAVVYSLWVAVCFTVFALGAARVHATVDSDRRDLRLFFVATVLAVAASRVGWRAFAVGQSAPIAAAGLMLLVVHLSARDSAISADDHSVGIVFMCYLLVLWKLHYIALAGGLHFMLGRPRRAIVYATGAGAIAVGLPSVFDPTLLTTYINQLFHFAGGGFPGEYVQVGQATEGGSGVTLRAMLREIGPDTLADGLSWGIFGGAMLGLVWLRISGFGFGWRAVDDESYTVSDRSALGALFLAAVLVLLPYLGRYDDLLLLVVVTIVVVRPQLPRSPWVAAATVLLLGLACLSPAPDLGGSAAIVLGAKSGALLLLLWFTMAAGITSSARVSRVSPNAQELSDQASSPGTGTGGAT